MIEPGASALLTDLYQFTMLQAYCQAGLTRTAVFEFFVRRLPRPRNFLLAAGLEQVLNYLESLRFTDEEIQWLAGTGRFHADVLDFFRSFRFTGDVDAMPEGTIFFQDEPILRVTAPLPEAQFVESRVINLLHFQTLIASKAARSVLVSRDKPLIDFGMRRAHGAEAALLAARASYLAGFAGTATVQAGALWQIPTFGTMAHSLVQAHDDELDAFEQFARANPDDVVLLLDTYDSEAAAAKLPALAARLRTRGIAIRAVRLDSGDLAAHARHVRQILDAGGLSDLRIFASGNLDEYALDQLVAAEAPIDAFGIGTRLDVSADAPYLDCAYKLQAYAGKPRRKRSEGKATWPGVKQVYRSFGPDGRMRADTVTLIDTASAGEPLLVPVMRGGRRLAPPASLAELRTQTNKNLTRLPVSLRALDPAPSYEVRISQALDALANALDEAHGHSEERP